MPNTIKIAIPMAGHGSRMRPQTWSRPKPLLALAGKTLLDHALNQFNTLPAGYEPEFVFIVGPNGEQVKTYMDHHHPGVKTHFLQQVRMRGQSDALYLAHELLSGPMLMSFCDTLIETDLSFLASETRDGVAWVKEVPDPRRFGVAVLDDQGAVARLVEKPKEMDNNLVVVGFYYFRQGEALMAAIDDQIKGGVMLNGEFFLADAINLWLKAGNRMRPERVETWLDAGVPETVLETNAYLLDHGASNSFEPRPGVAVIPPVFIHPEAEVESSVIGPHVSIAAGCHVKDAVLRNVILDEGARVEGVVVENSLLGKRAHLAGHPARTHLGDDAWSKS